MGKPQAPKIPSATELAGAQTGSNVSTAIAQQQLNAVNTVGPAGSVTYSTNGTYDYTDPSTGKVYKLPKMVQTTAMDPSQKAIYDADVAQLGTPFDLNNDATETRINELASKRLDPKIEQQRAALENRLAQQGIRIGSTAYDRAVGDFGQQENDARNQLLLTGRNQAVQEALLARSTPFNEMLALTGRTPAATPQTGLAGTDVAGLGANQFGQQMQQYQQQMQQYNSTLGGLFGLGGNLALAFSDARLKTDFKREGKTKGGLGIFSYRFKGKPDREVGVIAQEVAAKQPENAYVHPSGYMAVDYAGIN